MLFYLVAEKTTPMALKPILQHTWETYTKHFWLIMFMAVPGLFALVIPSLVGTPTFAALGATYLRTNSIPDLTQAKTAVMIVTVMLSLFLMSFAIVNINIVIRSSRTLTHVREEIMQSLGTTTLSVFWVYLMAEIILLIVQLYTFQLGAQSLLAPLLNGAVGMVILLMPTAMVIDEIRAGRALERSIQTILRKLPLFGLWLLMGLISLSIVELVLLAILRPWAPTLMVLFSSLILMPFMVVSLGQIYISKYTIIDTSN